MIIQSALIQMHIHEATQNNIDHALSLIEEAAQQGAKLIALPEMFIAPYDVHRFANIAVSDHHPMWNSFIDLSFTYKIVIVAGTVIENEGSNLYNTSYIFDSGKCIGKHRKAHLFDIDIPNKIVFKESTYLNAGRSITTVSSSLGTLGIAICFDLRFPELFKKMALSGASIMIVPAAFNLITGPLHWDLLIRARAIDSQSFVLVCSPPLQEELSYKAYGHTMVADPKGKIINTLSDQPNILFTSIDLELVNEARQQLPVLSSTYFLGKN